VKSDVIKLKSRLKYGTKQHKCLITHEFDESMEKNTKTARTAVLIKLLHLDYYQYKIQTSVNSSLKMSL